MYLGTHQIHPKWHYLIIDVNEILFQLPNLNNSTNKEVMFGIKICIQIDSLGGVVFLVLCWLNLIDNKADKRAKLPASIFATNEKLILKMK